jgi:hypothetical protein
MRGQLALRVDPMPFGAKADARQAEAYDRAPLGLRQVPLEPDEAARRGQTGQQTPWIDAEHAPELTRRRVRIEHRGRVREQRRLGVVGRDQIAVPIDDVGAPRALWRARDRLTLRRRVDRHQGQIDQAQAQHDEGHDEDAADQAQPAARRQEPRITAHDVRPRPWTPPAATAAAA